MSYDFLNEDLSRIADFVRGMFDDFDDEDGFLLGEMMWLDSDFDPHEDFDVVNKIKDMVPYVDDVELGCSKITIVLNRLADFEVNGITDYVIKMPFRGRIVGNTKIQYTQATSSWEKDGWDYCKFEEHVYKEACAQDIECLFCGTRYLCDIQGEPVYVSQRCTPYDSEDDDSYYCSASDDTKNFVNGSKDKISSVEMGNDVAAKFYDYWGESVTIGLIDFLDEYGVNDCHSGNIGYRNKGVCIFDYSGFNC